MESTLHEHELIDNLFARINYERQPPHVPVDFKLSSLIRLLDQIENPHLDYPVIHVAGTKGKGSVCAFIGTILDRAGMKVGVYSSPHLERINQRIVIDGAEISNDQLVNVLKRLDPVVREFDKQADEAGAKKLTFFEVITAAAFLAFAEADVAAVVLEVGMGGRLDSTNVCRPDLCVITNISLDHTKQLGGTVDKIASEKAGIIKAGVPVISGVTDVESQNVIRSVAKRNNSLLIELVEDFWIERDPSKQNRFNFVANHSGSRSKLDNLNCGMRGEHQLQNAAIAIATCQCLIGNGWPISEDNIRQGVSNAILPGRCELFRNGALVVLDMAHNAASTAALANTLENESSEFNSARKKTLIFAVSHEKDIEAMIQPLAGIFDSIILTMYQDNPRGRAVEDLFRIVSSQVSKTGPAINVRVAENPYLAWQQAIADAAECDVICITGSAFLVAETRPLIVAWLNNR